MRDGRAGEVAVIFVSERTDADAPGYAAAATRMERLAAAQPGYRGIVAARGTDGVGITVSYWADAAAAAAWRDHPDHQATREAGRRDWYERYEVVVADVARDYRWHRG